MTDTQKFYVIEHWYAGFNFKDDPNRYRDYMTIDTRPGAKNLSGEACTRGWLGTTNDWSERAHGVFDSERDARAWVEDCLLGDDPAAYTSGYFEVGVDGRYYAEDRVAVYLQGGYETQMRAQDWLGCVTREDILQVLNDDHDGDAHSLARAEQDEAMTEGVYIDHDELERGIREMVS